MSLEQNKAIVRRFYDEVVSQGNLVVAEEILAPDLNFAGVFQSRDDFTTFLLRYRTAFPDFHFTIEDSIAEGDKVVVRLTIRGTHKGKFRNIEPTSKQVEFTGMEMLRVTDGKIQQVWVNVDTLRQMEQLGARLVGPDQSEA